MQKPSKTYELKASLITRFPIFFTIVGGDTVEWFFVNTKEMESFQWITALMTSYSKRLEGGCDIAIIIDEMKETFQPNGAYFLEDGSGREVRSLVHHLGLVLEGHVYGVAV